MGRRPYCCDCCSYQLLRDPRSDMCDEYEMIKPKLIFSLRISDKHWQTKVLPKTYIYIYTRMYVCIYTYSNRKPPPKVGQHLFFFLAVSTIVSSWYLCSSHITRGLMLWIVSWWNLCFQHAVESGTRISHTDPPVTLAPIHGILSPRIP